VDIVKRDISILHHELPGSDGVCWRLLEKHFLHSKMAALPTMSQAAKLTRTWVCRPWAELTKLKAGV